MLSSPGLYYHLLFLLCLLPCLKFFTLLLSSGLGDNSTNSKDGTKADASSKSSNNTGREVLLICLIVAVVVGVSVVLFKLWQKKKREEQHARLLRLFEEDDELEVELGLRD